MATASEAADKLREARKAEADTAQHPAAEARARKIQEEQKAEFHGPTTAMLDAMQPFNIEGGEGQVHDMAARQAKVAAQQALKDAGRHLMNITDIRPLIRQHPWIALGGAAAVGFAAAALLVPSEKQRAAARLRALERALDAETRVGGRRVGGATSGSRLLRLGWRIARPTLLSLVTGAITGAATGAAVGSEAGAQSGQEAGSRAAGSRDGEADLPPEVP